ncbi:MAG TPA: hypothetical protein PKE64_24260 [Anaerolineae bacterium]|nr:hypothetical protein [Anaerolineae bacterium]HMR67138.1 hypothetical protein [Anaerolineae bacterium]
MIKRYTQAQLKRQLEIILTNGKLPVAQEVIELVGYNVQALDEVSGMLHSWDTHQARTKTLLLEQKQATQAEATTREAAQQQVNQFSRTAKVLFRKDEAVLQSLGLKAARVRNGVAHGSENGAELEESGSGNGTAPVRRSTSKAAAATIDRWRQMFIVAQGLAEPYREQLAQTGWPAERLAQALALVETWAEVDNRQQEAFQAYRANLKTAMALETQLRDWLSGFRQLTRVAIQQGDPEDQVQLRELMKI